VSNAVATPLLRFAPDVLETQATPASLRISLKNLVVVVFPFVADIKTLPLTKLRDNLERAFG
jgi:hypothetical protein